MVVDGWLLNGWLLMGGSKPRSSDVVYGGNE